MDVRDEVAKSDTSEGIIVNVEDRLPDIKIPPRIPLRLTAATWQ